MIIPNKHNGFTRDGVRRLYISGGNSSPAPQPTTTITESEPTVTNRTTANEIPQYLTNASQDLVAKGAALTSRPYEAYTGARVAEFSPDMQTAFGRMRNQGVAGQTAEASGLASLAGQRAMDYGQFQTGVQQYMNPYMQGVVDIERRKAQEAADQQSAILSGQATKQGAFGGSGAALQQRALTRDTARQLSDIQTQGLNRAYEGAVNQYNTGISSGLAASQQLGGLGQQQFGQEMDIIKGLGTSGDVQRQREQALLDVGYGDFLTKQKYPYEQLAFQQGLVSGVPYSTTQRVNEVSTPGKTVSQQTATKEQPNTASQLVGASVAAYGALGDDPYGSNRDNRAAGGEIKRYAVGGITDLDPMQMNSAVKGMSDQQVGDTASVPGLPGLTAQTEQDRRNQLRMAAEGQQAPASMNKITSILSQMSDAELQQYAKLNKNDPYTMALVVSEADRRKEGGMPTQEQPKVVDQQIASMALPEDQGIAQLPVGNMEFADGGIIAFSGGGNTWWEGWEQEQERLQEPPQESSAWGRNIMRALTKSDDVDALLASAAEKQARGLPLTPIEAKVVQEAMASQEAAPVVAAAQDAGISNLIQPSAARDQKFLQRQDPSSGGVAEALAAKTAANQGAGPAPSGAGGSGGAGGYSGIMSLLDKAYAERKKVEEEAIGIENTAMAEEVAAQKAAIEEAKKYGSDREERLKKREEGMKGEKERNINTTFIEAGLAIMAGESSNALLNIAKGARLGLQGYEERLAKINASKEKLDDDFSRLYELRQEKVGAAGDKLREIKKAEASLKANAKRNLGDLASNLAGEKIKVSTKQIEAAESRFTAGISSNTPDRQLFADLVAKNKGDKVAAYKQYSAMTAKAGGLSPAKDKYLEKLYEDRAEIISAQYSSPEQQNALARIDKEIQSLTGGAGASGGKITTMAEIRALAAKRGVPEQQIMDVAKAKGYIIQ